jgi:hypothetical protein
MLVHRTDVFLKDDVLRRGGTDDLREPPQVGRAPSGPACVTNIGSEHKGCETQLGVFKIAERIFTGPREVANRFIVDLGDLDHSESPRARQAGQWQGVPTIRLHTVTGLFGNQRRRHPPTGIGFFR